MRSSEREATRARARSVAAGALAVLVLLALPRAAAANEEDSKTLFAAGRELRAQNRCEEAIVQFRRALEIYPEGLGSLRNIAECEELLGKHAAARRDWWDLRRAVLQSTEPKYEGWDKDAESRYAALASKVAKLTVKLSGDRLERVKVSIDGKPLDPRLIGTELERDLGAHSLEAAYGGVAPVVEKVTLTEGARAEITLRIPNAAPRAADAGAAPIAPSADSGGAARAGGFVALGVGGLGAAATVIAAVVRGGALSDVEDGCPAYDSGGPCPASLEGAYRRAETAALLTNVFGAVAIAGLGTGITLLVVTSGDPTGPTAAPKTPAKGAWLGVHPVAGGAGASLAGRF